MPSQHWKWEEFTGERRTPSAAECYAARDRWQRDNPPPAPAGRRRWFDRCRP